MWMGRGLYMMMGCFLYGQGFVYVDRRRGLYIRMGSGLWIGGGVYI